MGERLAKWLGWIVGAIIVSAMFAFLGDTGKLILSLTFLACVAAYNFWRWHQSRGQEDTLRIQDGRLVRKRTFTLLAGVVAALIVGIVAALMVVRPPWLYRTSSEWTRFVSTAGGFAVLGPGTPREDRTTLNSPAGKIEMHTFAFERKSPPMWLTVAVSDYASSMLRFGPEVALDGARDGAVANIGGRLLSERRIFLGAHPGRELMIEARKSEALRGLLRARIYLVGQRSYMLMAVTTEEERLKRNDVSMFLDSFTLLGE